MRECVCECLPLRRPTAHTKTVYMLRGPPLRARTPRDCTLSCKDAPCTPLFCPFFSFAFFLTAPGLTSPVSGRIV